MNLRNRAVSAAGASLVAVSALTLSAAPPAAAGNPQHVAVGAIRWDGQVGDSAVGELAGVGPDEERALGPAKWRSHAPYYAVDTGTDSISMNGATQQVVDQEIEMAKDAGIDYWAFDWYGDETGLQTARKLYLQSAHRNDVNWSAILFTHPLSAPDLDTLVTQFQAQNYQKVDGGRPLLYAFDYPDLVNTAQISELRTKTQQAMGVTPYVVGLDTTVAEQIGADAVSSYVTGGSGHQAYAPHAAAEQAAWNSAKASGRDVIPWVTSGWDPQPRVQLSPPYPWASYPGNEGITQATPGELAQHLQGAIDWNAANASSAPAQSVLMYAWNEFSEGGSIEPVRSGPGSSWDLLDAVATVTKGGSADNGASSGTPLVTSDTPGTLRNDYSDFVGMSFTTGASPVTVTELGRKYVPGNSQVHVVKLMKADGSELVSVHLDMAAGSPDAAGYTYTPVPEQMTLAPHTTYYVLSSELSGGDRWYDADSAVTTSGAATVGGGVYRQLDADNNPVYHPYGTAGHGYGPVNLRYTN
ncbi:hypothetical protein [Streptomyces sp. NPDC021224]|uniref:hypothetical protein n=1 Tax=unclassified Streptomyces TaxID=2593676 RepID=UPI003787C435